ncbi:MAG TPA: hypothetical protein VFY24_02500 [Azospira sp.]|nr:hypothetical protein [Azospira sp.]
MKRKETGFINFGAMTLLVGGLALAGLLLYGWQSGQELPLWPAIAVVLVNLFAAVRIVLNIRKAKQQRATAGSGAAPR